MSARTARRTRQPEAAANRHRHSDQARSEQLQRDNERLQREIEDLRRKIAERDQQIADAEKQIADLERQLARSEEHTSELQSLAYLVCRLLLEKKKITKKQGN